MSPSLVLSQKIEIRRLPSPLSNQFISGMLKAVAIAIAKGKSEAVKPVDLNCEVIFTVFLVTYL